MFEERLKFITALYELCEICKTHSTCATCYCADLCDLLESNGILGAVHQIKKKENGDE